MYILASLSEIGRMRLPRGSPFSHKDPESIFRSGPCCFHCCSFELYNRTWNQIWWYLQHCSFDSSFFGCPGSFMLLRELYDFFFLFYVKTGLGILVRITLTPLIAFSKIASFTEPIKYKLASSKFHDYVKLGSLAMALLPTNVPTM